MSVQTKSTIQVHPLNVLSQFVKSTVNVDRSSAMVRAVDTCEKNRTISFVYKVRPTATVY